MNPAIHPSQQLTQCSEADLRLSGRAAELLAQVAAPPALGPAALARIEARLLAETAPRSSLFRLSIMAPAVAGFCGVLVGALLLRGLPGHETPGKLALVAPRPACQGAACEPNREVRVPNGGSARLSLPSAPDAELTLLGPGLVRLPSGSAGATGQPLTLSAGRLLARAGQGALAVAVPDGTVTIRPGGAAEIEVAQRRGVRVAAYIGSCALSLDGGTEAMVSAGSSWTAEGAAAVEPAQRTEALLRLGVAPNELPALPNPETKPEANQTKTTPAVARSTRPHLKEVHSAAPAAEQAATGDTEPAAPASPEVPTTLQRESLLLGQALQHLRRERDGERALSSLDEYQQRFPAGALLPEAATARVDALLLLGRSEAALQQLERLDLSGNPRRAELTVLRGELRGRAGRDAGALADFTQALNDGVEGALLERALYGRARSRARGGDVAGAQEDLRRYLARFPSGKFSDEAREAVGK